MDPANPKVLEWEALMGNYQGVAAGSDPVHRWVLIEKKVFDLAAQ